LLASQQMAELHYRCCWSSFGRRSQHSQTCPLGECERRLLWCWYSFCEIVQSFRINHGNE
jgi:hypothetical protein